jgi:drug/metabolite transporter (DMT)-like permease
MDSIRKAYWMLHVAVLLAGFTGVLGKFITLNEGLLVWYRMLFSVMLLWGIVMFARKKYQVQLHDFWRIGSVGIVIMIHWLFFYASIKYSNVSIGVVCYCLTSFFTAIFSPLINRQRLVIIELCLSALTLMGILLIFHFDITFRVGIMLGVISSSFAALYTILNEPLVKRYDSILLNTYQLSVGFILLTVLLPIYLHFFPVNTVIPSLTDVLATIFLAFFCTVLLYILFSKALKQIPAFTVNLSFNLEPVYAILLAFIFFHERKELSSSFYVGICFVIASVLLQTWRMMRKSRT